DPGLRGGNEPRDHRGRADAHHLPASDAVRDDEGSGAGCVRACAEYVRPRVTRSLRPHPEEPAVAQRGRASRRTRAAEAAATPWFETRRCASLLTMRWN